MPEIVGPTLVLSIDGRPALLGAEQFDAAVRRIQAGGGQIDNSLRGVQGSLERLRTAATSSQQALPAFAGGLAGGILGQFGAQARAQQFGFRLEVVEIGHDEDGDPVTSCVAVASGVAPPTAKRITGAASIALRLLHNAIINAGEALPACTHIPPSVLAVRMELWRRYCDSGQVSDGDTPDAKRKAFKRAAARLQEISAIGVWGDWVWLAHPDIKRTCPDTVRARKGRETGRTRTPPYRVSVVRPPSQWPNRSCVKLSRTKMDTPPLRLETSAEAATYTTTFRVGRKCRVTVTMSPARQGEVRSAVFAGTGSFQRSLERIPITGLLGSRDFRRRSRNAEPLRQSVQQHSKARSTAPLSTSAGSSVGRRP